MRKTRPRIHRVAAEVVEAEDRPPAGGVQAVRQSGLPGAAWTGEDDDAPAVRGRGQPEVLAVSRSVHRGLGGVRAVDEHDQLPRGQDAV